MSNILDQIQDHKIMSLTNTSVQDMESSLAHYTYLNIKDVETVKLALSICERRNEKTKVSILRRKLKRMEKQTAHAKALFKSNKQS